MVHGGKEGSSRIIYRAALLGGLFIVFTMASYRAATALRRGTVQAAPAAAAAVTVPAAARNPFKSGRYLLAYVLVASDCGYSTERLARKALRALPDSLRAVHGAAFTNVSVVGVALDEDLGAGIRFLKELGRSGRGFDEISVGKGWLNEQIVRLVWREGMATPSLPQVVLVARRVDARTYPRHIDTQRDSVLLTVTGRNDIVAWVSAGVPLGFRPRGKITL
jgi:hypothetical protein